MERPFQQKKPHNDESFSTDKKSENASFFSYKEWCAYAYTRLIAVLGFHLTNFFLKMMLQRIKIQRTC